MNRMIEDDNLALMEDAVARLQYILTNTKRNNRTIQLLKSYTSSIEELIKDVKR